MASPEPPPLPESALEERFLTREANREDARRRLAQMVAEAHIRPERRVKTKPSKAAKARRVETKSQRGAIKQGRARPKIE
jgi:ribosome-associated protein